jgi:uncharacterized protein
VVDQAGILRPEQVVDLKSKAEALYAQTGRAFAVATVKSLEGYPIEDYAYRLGRAWGLGQKGSNEGVLLLVAPTERKVWIATGYGAGGNMTDATSGIIVRETIIPHFKQNPPDYGGGIEAGADAIIKQMSLSPDQAQKNAAAAQQAQKQRRSSGGGALPAIFWAMIIGFVVLSMFRRAGGRRYRSRHSSAEASAAEVAAEADSAGSAEARSAAAEPGGVGDATERSRPRQGQQGDRCG